ncbi:hypothetical protein C5167_040203 [Papaver somniferum]|uniref:VOC domain-containing protein n=1 Tax=Papaver somniferum TaxID=3469 RepID=A0A4Y7IEA7_PAPSO|nr:uncharacterized protein At5g48480-like [Papaver somniferum]RZC47247.1 hypothetical protein C5167_040203 [Papaver somniferum]
MAEGDVAVPATVDLTNGSSDTTITENVVKSASSVSVISVKPQLVIQGSKAAEAIQFFKTAFGAEELKRDLHPKRKADQELPSVVSAELKLGSLVLVVSDLPDGTTTLANGTGYTFCLETEDVNGLVKGAVSAGAVLDGELTEGAEEGCCGGPAGKLTDPYGNVWLICSAKKGQVTGVAA